MWQTMDQLYMYIMQGKCERSNVENTLEITYMLAKKMFMLKCSKKIDQLYT